MLLYLLSCGAVFCARLALKASLQGRCSPVRYLPMVHNERTIVLLFLIWTWWFWESGWLMLTLLVVWTLIVDSTDCLVWWPVALHYLIDLVSPSTGVVLFLGCVTADFCLQERFICTAFGRPLCELEPVSGKDMDHITGACRQTTADGVTAQLSRMAGKTRITGAWRVHYTWDGGPLKRWRKFRAQRAGCDHSPVTTSLIWTWHASFPERVSAIAAGGFKLKRELGKLFGNGVYQSSLCDTALWYADTRYQPASGSALLLLSRTAVGRVERIQTYAVNSRMTKDTYLVLHTDHGRLGKVSKHLSKWSPSRWWMTVRGAGKVSGEEVVVADPSQVLPQYIVAFTDVKGR